MVSSGNCQINLTTPDFKKWEKSQKEVKVSV